MKSQEYIIHALAHVIKKHQRSFSPMVVLQVCAISLYLCKIAPTVLKELTEAKSRLTDGKYRNLVIDTLTELEQNQSHRIPEGMLTGLFDENRYLDVDLLFAAFDTVRKNETLDNAHIFSALTETFSDSFFGRRVDFDSPHGLDRLVARLAVAGAEKTHEQPIGICDPVCGTGGFLVECARKIGNQNVALAGMEKDPGTCRLARINLLLNDLDPSDILECDTLQNPGLMDDDKLKQYDILMASVPVRVKLHRNDLSFQGDLSRFHLENTSHFRLPRRVEYLFIRHIINSMREDTGRAVMLVTANSLFAGGHRKDIETFEKSTREYLVENNILDAVIMLPGNLVFSGSHSLAIVVLDNRRRHRSHHSDDKKVLFLKAVDREFFQHGKRRRILLPDHIDKICDLYINRTVVEGFSELVSASQIRQNNYDLSVARYFETRKEPARLANLKQDMVRVEGELEKIKGEIEDVVSRIMTDNQ